MESRDLEQTSLGRGRPWYHASWMNTFNPYVVGTSCILKGGDRADHRMTELNELIASAKASGRAPVVISAVCLSARCPAIRLRVQRERMSVRGRLV